MYDYVIMMRLAGMGDNLLIAIGGADHIVLVINPEIASMRDAEMMTAFLAETGGSYQIHYLINKLNLKLVRAGLAPSVEEVTRGMRGQVLGLIPYDENIHISTNLGVPIALCPRVRSRRTSCALPSASGSFSDGGLHTSCEAETMMNQKSLYHNSLCTDFFLVHTASAYNGALVCVLP